VRLYTLLPPSRQPCPLPQASATVNVSEDIFAGYTAMLRGGESGHIEFMQMGKVRRGEE